MRKLFAIVAIAIMCAGCATGSGVVTGTKRQALEPAQVLMYPKPPADYEVIGVVKATSEMGLTEQQSMDYAVAELKKQAAAIGANGLIVTGVGGGSDDASLAAEAIYVMKK